MALYEKTAAELSKMLASKECSAKELTESVFERIEQTEGKIDAYITLNKENAMKKAEEVDKMRAEGKELSKLAGIPIGIKDNICTNGVLTTCASKMLYNFCPPYDATVMSKINTNDMVMTGKLNMDEFAMGSSCENSYFKKTKNPHNTQYVPGGSSGGSASAVAAGSAVVALGSDTGGSIRQPASLCGVVGLKPTYGAVSRYGLVAFASSLDQIGPMGRSVEDVAMVFDAISGSDIMDATSVDYEHKVISGNMTCDPKKLRIGVPKEYYGEGVDEDVKELVMQALKKYESAGAEIVELSLPSTDYALSAYYIIASAEASSNLARYDGVKYGYRTENYTNLMEMYENTRSEGFGDEVKRRIMLGTFVLSSGFYDAYYKKARLFQEDVKKEFANAFQKCDVIITPTSPSTAFKLGEMVNDPVKMYAADVCTVTVNIAGLPAVSVPCGNGKNGLPVGMQLIGPKFSEFKLLSTADYYEKNFSSAAKIAEVK